MAIITFICIFCLINFAGGMDAAPALRRLEEGQITPSGTAVKDTRKQIEAKAITGGTAISGHDTAATSKYEKATRKTMYVTLSEGVCNPKPCWDKDDPDSYCSSLPQCLYCGQNGFCGS